jgi:hypothetical protein
MIDYDLDETGTDVQSDVLLLRENIFISSPALLFRY